jgi:hypothetical protein
MNLNIDGTTKAHFSVTGFIGDKFSMDVPKINKSALTGGTDHISGTYNQVKQTYNVNYYYVSSTITFNLYDSAGDYITSYSTSGKYGQYFSYGLPSTVTDNYGYVYHAEFNNPINGYYGAQNESYNIVYQYTGPRAYYQPTDYKPTNNDIQFTLMDVKNQSSSLVTLANRVGITPQQLRITLLDYGLPPGISSSDGTIKTDSSGHKYLIVTTYDSATRTRTYTYYPINSDAPVTKQPAPAPKNTAPGAILVTPGRNFWVWDGTTWIKTAWSNLPPEFTNSWLGKTGIWNYSNGKGVNEKNDFTKLGDWFQANQSNILNLGGNGVILIIGALGYTRAVEIGPEAIQITNEEEADRLAKLQEILNDFKNDGEVVVEGATSIPDPETVANDVAEYYGSEVTPLKNGYSVKVDTGGKPITVRVMGEGSGGRSAPYYRIGVDGKGGLAPDGTFSSDRAITHTDLSPSSVNEIIGIINKYLGR